MGHFARVCRSKTNKNTRKQKINYLEETYTEEEESEPEEIQQITQINRVLPDENDNYGINLKINGKHQNFTIDTGSPVTIMTNNPELYNQRDIKPLKERYQDVNKNEIQFLGKIWADIEYNGTTTKLPILITKRNDITPLLGVNGLKQLPITINKIQLDEPTNQSETIYAKFNKLFETNHTIKIIEVKIQIKPGCYPIQQKARPIPHHLQKYVKNELDRLIESEHLERLETIEEDCFVSPVVITVKKDKTVKIALDARKLNDSCVKKRPRMPNMEELLNQISAELSKNDREPIWISVVDLDYAYGQMKLAPETSKHCPDLIELNCCIEDNKWDQIPQNYETVAKKLTYRWGIILVDDRIVIPKSLRYAAFNALHFGHPGISKMYNDAAIFWWPNMREDIEKKSKTCSACLNAGKNLKFQIPQTEKSKIEPPKTPGEEIQIDFTGNLNNKKLQSNPFILIAVDKKSRWPVAKICKNTNHETVISFLDEYINVYGVPKQIKSDKGGDFISK